MAEAIETIGSIGSIESIEVNIDFGADCVLSPNTKPVTQQL